MSINNICKNNYFSGVWSDSVDARKSVGDFYDKVNTYNSDDNKKIEIPKYFWKAFCYPGGFVNGHQVAAISWVYVQRNLMSEIHSKSDNFLTPTDFKEL